VHRSQLAEFALELVSANLQPLTDLIGTRHRATAIVTAPAGDESRHRAV
jgi:hypothetical protein